MFLSAQSEREYPSMFKLEIYFEMLQVFDKNFVRLLTV